MKFLSLQVVFVLVALSGCVRTVLLQPPQPIHAVAGAAATKEAIIVALSRRGWIVREQHLGVVSAVLIIRRHKLWVDIHYNAQRVQVVFRGSEGLFERRTGTAIHIHPRVNTWLGNLNSDLAMSLQGQGAPGGWARVPDGPLPPAPPTGDGY